MSDFRKWFSALAVATLMLGGAVSANAQTPGTEERRCVVETEAAGTLLRGEGLTELVGEVKITCATFSANAAIATFQIFANTNITNRFTGVSTSATNALLVAEDQTVGNPPTVFTGSRISDSAISFSNVPLPVATPTSTQRVYRLQNVRVNAAQIAGPAGLLPSSVVMTVIITSPAPVNVVNNQVTVGFIQSGLAFARRTCAGGGTTNNTLSPLGEQTAFLQCDELGKNFGTTGNDRGTPAFSVRYSENFNTAFKTQAAEGADADTGTRLAARFTNVPTGVRIFVSRTSIYTPNSTGGDLSSGTAAAVFVAGHDANGAGGFPLTTPSNSFVGNTCGAAAPGGTTAVDLVEVPVVGGSAVAVWQITAAEPTAVERVAFAVGFKWAPGAPALGTISLAGSFAPFYTPPTGGVMASSIFPIPRFIDTPAGSVTMPINPCVTNLLFPFVSNTGGFDTGISIANTSRDTFSTIGQQGTCTVNYFGTTLAGTTPDPRTSSSVASGDTLLFSLSSGGSHDIVATPGFQGYIIANCQFRYAHGFAFISDVGASRLAMGYLALVMDAPTATGRTGASSESLGQ